MKTNILFIDDSENEVRDLLIGTLAPLLETKLQEIDNPVAIRHFAQTIFIPPPLELPLLEIAFKTPAQLTLGEKGIEELAGQFDAFLIDLCWDDKDATNRDGAKFAENLHNAGVGYNRIMIITNNEQVRGDVAQGYWGGRDLRSCTKYEPGINVAVDMLIGSLSGPTRHSIPTSKLISKVVHGVGNESAIDAYFHPGKGRPTWRSVMEECTTLCSDSLIECEAECLMEALKNVMRNSDLDVTADVPGRGEVQRVGIDYLERKGSGNPLACLTPQLKELAEADWGLNHLLFPEVRPEFNRPFRKLVEQCFENTSNLTTIWWDDDVPCLLDADSITQGCGAVPLSWFMDFMPTSDWIRDMGTHLQAEKELGADGLLRIGCFATRNTRHPCLFLWHTGNGFPDEYTLRNCAKKMLRGAVNFTHIFIGSVCRGDQSRHLVELLPNATVREMNCLRVVLGETVLDVNRLSEGSFYLFVIP